MAMVIVTTDEQEQVLMSEEVKPVHLADEHSSLQILERLSWAISAADMIESPAPAGMPVISASLG